MNTPRHRTGRASWYASADEDLARLYERIHALANQTTVRESRNFLEGALSSIQSARIYLESAQRKDPRA